MNISCKNATVQNNLKFSNQASQPDGQTFNFFYCLAKEPKVQSRCAYKAVLISGRQKIRRAGSLSESRAVLGILWRVFENVHSSQRPAESLEEDRIFGNPEDKNIRSISFQLSLELPLEYGNSEWSHCCSTFFSPAKPITLWRIKPATHQFCRSREHYHDQIFNITAIM